MKIDPRIRALVFDQHQKDRPGAGRQYEAWVEETTKKFDCTELAVRRIVAEESATYSRELQRQSMSAAQQAANLLGASVEAAIARLGEGLHATKKRMALDKSGRPVLNDDGKPIYVETDDWNTAIASARELIKIHGGYAPERVEVSTQTLNVNLTGAEALTQLNELQSRLAQLHQSVAARAGIAAGSPAGGAAVEVPGGDEKRRVLADGMHQDKGRAGQDRRSV